MLGLKRIEKLFVGSSFPVLVETTNNEKCILKMRGAGNGVRSLIQEFVVNDVAANLGWPVPKVFPVQISEGFPWEFGTDEFDDILQKSFGVNLGIEWIDGLAPVPATELASLPEKFLARMTALDAYFRNLDRTTKSMNVQRSSDGQFWMLDHGACQFLDSGFADKPMELSSTHFLKGKLVDPVELTALRRPDLIVSAVARIPEEWISEAGLNRSAIQESFQKRL